MGILSYSNPKDRAVIESLYGSLLDNGNSPQGAINLMNRLFNLDLVVCERCDVSLADTYQHEGQEWSVCALCEDGLPCGSDLVKMEAENA